MKKLLILLTVFLCSCEDGYVQVRNNIGVNPNSTRVRYDEVPFREIIHFEYKGHYYIKFFSRICKGAEAGVVHDPDCKCMKNRN
jgi:hypothetical protein